MSRQEPARTATAAERAATAQRVVEAQRAHWFAELDPSIAEQWRRVSPETVPAQR